MKSARNSIWKIDDFMFFFIPRLFIVIGATLSIQGCLDYQAAASFWNNAIATTGTIVKTRIETRTHDFPDSNFPDSSFPDSSFPGSDFPRTGRYSMFGGVTDSYTISTIRFTTLKREIVTFESDPDMCVNRPNSNPCEGRKVEIVYDSRKPHQAIVKGSASPLGRVLTRIGGGMLFVIFGIMFIKFNRDFEKFNQNFNRSFGRNIHR